MAEVFESHLELANVQSAIPTVVLIVALFRHLYSAVLSPFAPHTYALGMLAMMAKGRRTTRTDHAVAAVVPLSLLSEALRKECAERFQVKLLQPGELFWRQVRKRSKGFGRKCMRQLCQDLLLRTKSVCILVNEENQRALTFYRMCNFKVRGVYDSIFLRRSEPVGISN